MTTVTLNDTDTFEYRIRVEHDEFAESPRDDGVNMGTMACWHKRYQLGDEQPDVPPSEFLQEKADAGINVLITLPLYLLDHSGITISTTPFNCAWDSGQVGFIYVTLDTVREHFRVGADEEVTDDIIEKATIVLQAEVEEYDQFLRGDVYSVCIQARPRKVYDAEGNELEDVTCRWRTVEASSGFYGSNAEENGITDFVPSTLHHLIPK